MCTISDLEELPTSTRNSDQLPGIATTTSEPVSLSGFINELNIPEQSDHHQQNNMEGSQLPTLSASDINSLLNIPDQQQQSTICVQDIPAGTVPGQDLIDNIQQAPTLGQHVKPALACDAIGQNVKSSQPTTAGPHIVILEQPAPSMRFRYPKEVGKGGAGVLQGANSTSETKTFTKIQLRGFKGNKAYVKVSCVTDNSEKPKVHPHSLASPASVGGHNCKMGVWTQQVSSPDMTLELQHLGIQCTKKDDVKKALEEKELIGVDPYDQGFEHSKSPRMIDLNAVKLCFQAFFENPETPGTFTWVPPVCSETIFNQRKELQIMDMSSNRAPAMGGKKLIILCEQVSKNDIKVRFFQENTGWEAFGEFKPEDVHRQFAISLTVPPYMDGDIRENKQVWVELTKADGTQQSQRKEFYFTPAGGCVCGAVPSQEYFYTPGGAVPSTTSPKKVELSLRVESVPATQSKPVNIYHGGNIQITSPQTNPTFVQPVKMEESQQRQGKRAAKAAELVSGSIVVPRQMEKQDESNSNKGNTQFTSPQTNSELTDLNQELAAGDYSQPNGSPFSDISQSPFDNTMTQQSPNPQGLADIGSPIGNQIQSRSSRNPSMEEILGTKQGELENMSQDLNSLSLSPPSDFQQQQSNSLHTPNISNALSIGDARFTSGDLKFTSSLTNTELNLNILDTVLIPPLNMERSQQFTSGDLKFTSGEISAVLKNCPEVNQL